MFKLAWTWRGGSTQSLARILPALVFSALCFCLFTVAAGFSSSISSRVGNEVLLDGRGCGVVYTGSNTPETASALQAYISQKMNNAANYAQECYSSNPTGNFDCTNLIKDHLPGTMDDHAACPFQQGMCRSNDSNLLLDSGYLDSREHFGVNTPDSQRIFFRTTLHCAPMNTESFSKNISTPLNNYTQYFYGPSVENMNFTWQTKDLNAQYVITPDDALKSSAMDMSLSVMRAYTANKTVTSGSSMFAPVPGLFRPDADLVLIFLSGNGVAFYEPTDDPWYRGSTPWSQAFDAGYDRPGQFLKTVYRPDEAASPMGCIQQFQYCNAERKCGELASFYDATVTAAPFLDTPLEVIEGYANVSGQTSSQFSWFETIMYSAYDLSALLSDLGTASLLSRRTFDSGLLWQVPSDQWKLDVTHWWTTLLAVKQAVFVNAAHGPTDPSLLQHTIYPDNEYMRYLCRNQKVRSAKYTSFSLFGLYFVLTVGVITILASYLLEPIFQCLVQRRKYNEYKYLEWTGNETLQLQRMAYQGLGSESWSGYTDSIPKTRHGYFLADLHVEYSVDRTKGVGSAVKESAQMTITSLPQSQQRPNADGRESLTGTDGSESQTDAQVSSASNEMEISEAVSTTGVSSLEIPPGLMPDELNSGEPISPISQVSQPETSHMVVPPVPESRP